MSHPTFAFFLEAWSYIRQHNLKGWRPEKVSFKEWRLVKAAS